MTNIKRSVQLLIWEQFKTPDKFLRTLDTLESLQYSCYAGAVKGMFKLTNKCIDWKDNSNLFDKGTNIFCASYVRAPALVAVFDAMLFINGCGQ